MTEFIGSNLLHEKVRLFDIDQTADSLARTPAELALAELSRDADALNFNLELTTNRDMVKYPDPNRPKPRDLQDIIEEYRQQRQKII